MMGGEYAKRIVGRTTSAAVRAAESLSGLRGTNRRGALQNSDELDRTGILVSVANRLEVGWRDKEIIFPLYETSLAHSFWRAQEFSLFMRHLGMMQRPVLDFGCGDGSFAAALFDEVDFGVDIDAQALDLARKFGIYSNLVQSEGTRVPLPDASVRSVFSNSVLEHVKDLESAIAEISRLLEPSGLFLLTVPVAQFARDLERYFGRAESRQVNADYFHRNLLEVDEWRNLLARHGLALVSICEYQPAWFSFYYMMFRFFGNRVLGRVIPNIRSVVWRRHKERLVDMVRRSTDGTVRSGGNLFAIAQKVRK
jgi:SAM-dependent methyltransferase